METVIRFYGNPVQEMLTPISSRVSAQCCVNSRPCKHKWPKRSRRPWRPIADLARQDMALLSTSNLQCCSAFGMPKPDEAEKVDGNERREKQP